MLFSVLSTICAGPTKPNQARAGDRVVSPPLTLVLEQILLFFETTQNQDGQKFIRDNETGTHEAIVTEFVSKSEMKASESFANVRMTMRYACVCRKGESEGCGRTKHASRELRIGDIQAWRSGGCATRRESGRAIEPAHRAEFRTRERTHEERHGLGYATAIEFDMQASEIVAAIDIDRMDAERVAYKTMQRASRELRFARGHAHDELHCCALGCRVKKLARVAQ
ncbi:hypothetical protein [Paraburkholderia sp. J11-2]|uniref:hypothetical protein n=1 Tax=Paraburkholderia sp. J11-2 TaxID=2805431 RepID=UPI002AB614BC|nr:hypothetical protein [Paraburkholderia sp. J11-2]